MAEATDIDRTDRRILELLAGNGRLSMTELAELVHLSRPAVQARVRRLEERGVIRGYHADIRLPAPASSQKVLLVVRIGVRPCAPALAFLRSQPEVRRYWSVAGPRDAVIEVEAADAAAVSILIDRLSSSPFEIEAETLAVLWTFERGAAAFDKP